MSSRFVLVTKVRFLFFLISNFFLFVRSFSFCQQKSDVIFIAVTSFDKFNGVAELRPINLHTTIITHAPSRAKKKSRKREETNRMCGPPIYSKFTRRCSTHRAHEGKLMGWAKPKNKLQHLSGDWRPILRNISSCFNFFVCFFSHRRRCFFGCMCQQSGRCYLRLLRLLLFYYLRSFASYAVWRCVSTIH